MTRIKKTRKSGPLALRKADRKPTDAVPVTKGKENSKEKGKGKAAGSRYGSQTQSEQQSAAGELKDPRHGSKKAVPLTAPKKAMSPEKELLSLENDTRLQGLLDRAENGDILTKADQAWLDVQLARYQELADILGIDLDAEDDDDDNFEYDFNENDILDDEISNSKE
ncbi:hypothetical protein A28LD_0505 [Idiomarina sp. A28L]|uniref:Der GTPase-activating protein YihI n=1 Tax=Idiomarina sp. A28L TaxID=1036674 RepID=UPI0002138C85|nr:Der GTPase-activating protein YihI [Idiomarina sp. A28L]EGN76017.1 hypothetical protein A28LD_0505 [Idiomarina sp. A28L]